ncbi:MAG: YdeI/OmpD-associated family protein [Fibrobacteres bacterium]|nr:YdeI/OmpD-associated family protein [Fibrobacterota bacterium]
MPVSLYNNQISAGVVHNMAADLKIKLIADSSALTKWEAITPLARNEWLCWIESAKKIDTRQRRIELTIVKLKEGKSRPCCWPGCQHREK